MGKRAPQFARRPRDFYPTPIEAALPLLAHLPRGVRYWEPCAGDGALIGHLSGRAECVVATDLRPQDETIFRLDVMATDVSDIDCTGAGLIITNPPWPLPGQKGQPVIDLILHLTRMRPTWLLLAYDFAANGYFDRVRSICPKAVVVGRVSWEQNGVAGKDNAAWFLFDRSVDVPGPVLYGRPLPLERFAV